MPRPPTSPRAGSCQFRRQRPLSCSPATPGRRAAARRATRTYWREDAPIGDGGDRTGQATRVSGPDAAERFGRHRHADRSRHRGDAGRFARHHAGDGAVLQLHLPRLRSRRRIQPGAARQDRPPGARLRTRLRGHHRVHRRRQGRTAGLADPQRLPRHRDLPMPEENLDKARELLAEAGVGTASRSRRSIRRR
jgi:hypothetical protein